MSRQERMRERFYSKTREASEIRNGMSSPCLEWTACALKKGYGQFGIGIKVYLAHRVAWEIENGDIPSGMFVCHRCDNPKCVKVEHLFIGTRADNMADMVKKGRGGVGMMPSGEKHWMRLRPDKVLRGSQKPLAKLSDQIVKDIFKKRSQGFTIKGLANEFGVTTQLIGMVLNRKIWIHVKIESEMIS